MEDETAMAWLRDKLADVVEGFEALGGSKKQLTNGLVMATGVTLAEQLDTMPDAPPASVVVDNIAAWLPTVIDASRDGTSDAPSNLFH